MGGKYELDLSPDGFGRVLQLASKDERIAFERFALGRWKDAAAQDKEMGADCSAGWIEDAPEGQRAFSLSFSEKGLAVTRTDFPHFENFEWWLDWMEQRPGHDNDFIYGQAASALSLMLMRSRVPYFSSGLRPLAAGRTWNIPSTDSPKIYSAKDIGELYSDRLYALERKEPAPKIMSQVLRFYGLEPRALAHEQFVPEKIGPFLSANYRWMRVTLGPSTAFSKRSSNGLPFESSPDDDDDSGEQWREELSALDINRELVVTSVGFALRTPSDQVFSLGAFTIENGKWYPSILIRFDHADRTNGGDLNWPPDRQTLASLASTIERRGERKWVHLEIIR
jgi:hypothetical protein